MTSIDFLSVSANISWKYEKKLLWIDAQTLAYEHISVFSKFAVKFHE